MKLLRPQVKEANVNWLIIVGTHIPGNTIGKGSLHLCNCVSTLTFIFFLPAFVFDASCVSANSAVEL